MRKLDEPDLERYAGDIGLNVEQWKEDFNSELVKKHVKHQADLGAALGVRGTPNFFVNGENVRGAKPFDKFKPIIDRKLAEARNLEAAGTALAQLHAKTTERVMNGRYKLFVIDGKKPEPPPQPPALAQNAVELPINDSPRMGKGDKVIITEFSDFQ